MNCSPSGSSVHGILQARILEWVAILFPRGSSQPRDWTWVSHIVGRCFTVWATREVKLRSLINSHWDSLVPPISGNFFNGGMDVLSGLAQAKCSPHKVLALFPPLKKFPDHPSWLSMDNPFFEILLKSYLLCNPFLVTWDYIVSENLCTL